MNTDIKQAMHVEPAKSFGAAEAAENERRWDEAKIDFKNLDPTNHYDKTRLHLNFEIGPDGKIHPLGYQSRSLELRLQDRLSELGWKPFKPDSKIQPNCCARFIFGGNHDRTLQMALGSQPISLEHGADNSNLHRCSEIENWAKDVHSWCCKRYGKENVIGFQVHLDETSPHIHALIVPVGVRPKSGREGVMWSAKFGKDRYEYGRILKEMHTSLYEEVGSRYGLERGDSIEGRTVRHLSKRDYIRKLTREARQAENAIKGLQSMIRNLEAQIHLSRKQLEKMDSALASGKMELKEYQEQKAALEQQLSDCEAKLEDKAGKLHEKEQSLERLSHDLEQVGSVVQPFRNHRIDFSAPQIKGKVPLFGVDKWLEQQNSELESQFNAIISRIEALYRAEAERQVSSAQKSILVDYNQLRRLKAEVSGLTTENSEFRSMFEEVLNRLADPSFRTQIFNIADALIGGTPVPTSAGGGGSNPDSDLRWDGRNPGEEEEAYHRRCLVYAIAVVGRGAQSKGRKR